jgi:hypothetical protein
MEQNFQLHAQLRKDQGLQLSPPTGDRGGRRGDHQDVDALRAEVQQLRGELRQVTAENIAHGKENCCWQLAAKKNRFSLQHLGDLE